MLLELDVVSGYLTILRGLLLCEPVCAPLLNFLHLQLPVVKSSIA